MKILAAIGPLAWIGIVVIIGAKYLVPVLLVPFPFAAGWANFVLDTIDGDLLIPLGLEDATYQPIDKAADYVTYIFMVISAWRGRWPILKWIVAFFVLRTVGQALFFITGNEAIFFYFPNFLEAAVSDLRHHPLLQKGTGPGGVSSVADSDRNLHLRLQDAGRVHHPHRQHRP